MEIEARIWDNGAMQPESTDSLEPQEPPRTEGMATIPDVAAQLQLSEEKLNNWIASGELRAYRDRGEVLLRMVEVRRFLRGADAGLEPGDPDSSRIVIPVEELAAFFGVDASDLDALLDVGAFTEVRGPTGGRGILREEAARLFLASAGRARLLEAAGPDWPEIGDPAAVIGEGAPEELDDDATEETTLGEVDPLADGPRVRGAVTVCFFGRMSLRRTFPLLVHGARLSAAVRVVPRLPGCLCVPSGIDLSDEDPRGEFWITPQAVGPVPKGAVDLYSSGLKVIEIRTPFQVRSSAGAWVLLGLAAAFLALAPVMEFLEKNSGEDSSLGAIFGVLGGSVATGIVLSILCFLAGVIWIAWSSPRENRPLTVSLTQPAQGGEPPPGL